MSYKNYSLYTFNSILDIFKDSRIIFKDKSLLTLSILSITLTIQQYPIKMSNITLYLDVQDDIKDDDYDRMTVTITTEA